MKIIIDETNGRERRALALDLIKNIRRQDCPMLITIEPYIATHSDDQRALFHSLCRELGREVGYTEAEIKEYVKQEVLGKQTVTIGGVEREVVCSSEYDESGKKRDTVSYSSLIDGLYRIAAQAGITL